MIDRRQVHTTMQHASESRGERDITGHRFGRLTAIRRDGVGDCWQAKWICRCDCGNEVSVFKSNLMSGRTRSCGCLKSETMTRRNNGETTVGH